MGRKGRTVLVVDDDRINRSLLSKLLEHEGYEARTAVNGREALVARHQHARRRGRLSTLVGRRTWARRAAKRRRLRLVIRDAGAARPGLGWARGLSASFRSDVPRGPALPGVQPN